MLKVLTATPHQTYILFNTGRQYTSGGQLFTESGLRLQHRAMETE